MTNLYDKYGNLLIKVNNINPIEVTGPLTESQQQTISGTELTGNSSSAILASGATFTGQGVNVSHYASLVVAVLTDQAGTLYVEFSTDNSNWDSSLAYSVAASTNEVHRVSITRKYARIRFTNTSGSNQTYFRLQTLIGHQPPLTSPSNSILQSDVDTLVVRPLDFNMQLALGLYQNGTLTIKDGINFDIRSGSVPEDIINQGGVYAGFPSTIEAAQIVVAGADTGTVYYSYLESETSTDYTSASKAITGAGTYSLGHNIWRCNFAYFVGSSATAFNAGDITIRHSVTTTNIFAVIPAGYSQSYCAAYTVPYNSAIFLDRITATVRGGTSASLDGHFWYRAYGESPRLRFPFGVQFGQLYFDDVDYLIRIPGQTDLIPRIVFSTSASAAEVSATYRFIRIKS